MFVSGKTVQAMDRFIDLHHPLICLDAKGGSQLDGCACPRWDASTEMAELVRRRRMAILWFIRRSRQIYSTTNRMRVTAKVAAARA